MLKRATAIIFLALASILLLAHAVVPHHHHNKQVCFTYSHCNHEALTDEHGTTPDGHSHDGDNNHDNCVLREPIVVFSNQWKSDLIINITTDLSDLDDFHYNLLNSSPEFQIPILSTFLYERATNGSYTSLVSSSLGLRAPPVV